MKPAYYLLIVLFSLPYLLQAQDFDGVCKDVDAIAEQEAHQHEQVIHWRTNELTANYDLKYHRLEWTVDPSVLYIEGTVTSYFEPTSDNFLQINFDLGSSMQVNNVGYHGTSLNFTLSQDNLQITFPEILPNGVLDSLSISYEGQPANVGFGSFGISTHNNAPVLWTLSEPYGAKQWWPCKQDLNDKIDSIDVIVTTPAINRVASNGLLVNEYQEGTNKVYHWQHRYPIPAYLIAIAVTNYAVYSDFVEVPDGDPIEVLNYVYPESLNTAISQTDDIVPMMQLFNELFGLYPFADEKYGHAQFSWGGGMEHQTMSFMFNYSYGLQAHELAHQWFGDKITCGSWQDIWLNEGFATYLTGLTNEFLGSESSWDSWKQSRINTITSQPDGSVFVPDTTSVSRIFSSRLSYSKGAMLLHMLRWQLGDEDFFQGVRNYLNDPALAYGYAKTAHLQAHLEAQSGQDLDEFLADWYYGEGYPSYQLSWWPTGTGIGLTIDQSTSHSSVDFFEMPVPIRVSGEGQDSLLRLNHTASGQSFSISLPFTVDQVEFDPTRWLISANNTVEQIVVNTEEVEAWASAIQLFPNPVQDIVYIKLPQAFPAFESGYLMDAHGRRLFAFSPTQTELNLGALPAGMYNLVWVTERGLVTKRVIKE